MANGFTFYRGPSMLNRLPVRLVCSGILEPSRNRKTGPMIQFSALPDDKPPATIEDILAGCGDCKIKKMCYVDRSKAPYQQWKQDYPDYNPRKDAHLLRLYPHRYCMFGDPASIPAYVWKIIRRESKGHTGYTQQWEKPRFQHLKSWLMASCHNLAQKDKAESMGWKPYVITDSVLDGMKQCPYQKSEGAIRCAHCLLCDGNHGTIQITKHGSPSKLSHWEATQA